MNGDRILVVGGGIGGLTAAAALGQRGFEVTIVERGDGTGVEGVGISQQANVVRALAGLGLAQDYLNAGFAYDAVEIYAPDGSLIMRRLSRSLIEGYPASMGIPRPALHRVLREAAERAGATIRNGVTTARLDDRGDRVEVEFTDGGEGTYDAMIGADGIYSQMRRTLFPDAPQPARSRRSSLTVHGTRAVSHCSAMPFTPPRRIWGRAAAWRSRMQSF